MADSDVELVDPAPAPGDVWMWDDNDGTIDLVLSVDPDSAAVSVLAFVGGGWVYEEVDDYSDDPFGPGVVKILLARCGR